MNRVRANLTKLTRQTQARWAGFWRWYRAASHRTQIVVGIGALMGVFVLSSLAVVAFHAGAQPSGASGASGASGSMTRAPTATPHIAHGHNTPSRPTAAAIKHGHGHHKPGRRGR